MMTYLTVIYEFFKTGLFAIGGGLATIPFLSDIAEKYTWFEEELSNMIAVAESTPGPIGVNCATYAGVNALGVLGGIVSTLALVLPSIIVILIIAKALDKFQSNKYVNFAFCGIRPAVTALIAVAFVDVAKTALFGIDAFGKSGNLADLFNIPALVLFALLFAATNKLKWHPIIFIAISALVGIVLKF